MSDQVTTRLVDVLLPWSAELIPHRGRNLRTVYIGETIRVEIRAPEVDEARVAFRLFSRSSPQGNGIEVISSGGGLWWPFDMFLDDVREGHHRGDLALHRRNGTDAETLLECLANGAWDPLNLRAPLGITLYEDLLPYAELSPARIWEGDNREAMSALAQRRVADLLIWRRDAFVRGGEPVFLGDPHHAYPLDRIANVGADRSVEPTVTGLPFDVGGWARAQETFMRGNFRRADSEVLPAGRPSDTVIEVLMPEMVRLDHAAVQLDALYRCAQRALKRVEDPVWNEIRDHFAQISAGDAGTATSADRVDALVRLSRHAAGRKDLQEPLREVRESFLRFEASTDPSAEDDDALGRLGGAAP